MSNMIEKWKFIMYRYSIFYGLVSSKLYGWIWIRVFKVRIGDKIRICPDPESSSDRQSPYLFDLVEGGAEEAAAAW